MTTSTTMELRLFLLVVLFCALAASLPANHARERRTANPVLRDKGRDSMKTKQFRIGYRYGRAWQPSSLLDDNNVYGANNYNNDEYKYRNLPLIQQILDQLEGAEENGGY